VDPDDWFAQLTAALPGAVGGVGEEERIALLDLARVAAHTSERWTAPVTTFLVGLAYADAPADRRVAALRELVARFDGAGT
jgi:hypothetical protein